MVELSGGLPRIVGHPTGWRAQRTLKTAKKVEWQPRDSVSACTGVLFMNRPFNGDGVSLVDIAHTVLSALGVPKGDALEGRPWLI